MQRGYKEKIWRVVAPKAYKTTVPARIANISRWDLKGDCKLWSIKASLIWGKNWCRSAHGCCCGIGTTKWKTASSIWAASSRRSSCGWRRCLAGSARPWILWPTGCPSGNLRIEGLPRLHSQGRTQAQNPKSIYVVRTSGWKTASWHGASIQENP